jgi:hypothetical protein
MLQASRLLGFAEESLELRVRRSKTTGEDFDGHFSTNVTLLGQIDDPLAATTDLFQELEFPEATG